MTAAFSIVQALLAFGVLIAFHEWGHMQVARWAGMRVERFAVGFGPSLLRWQRGETEYALCAIPLGGYVRIAGMGDEEESASGADDPRAFWRMPVWKRMLVIGAGPAANYVLAFILGVGLLLAGGVEADEASTRLGGVQAGGPADAAGLLADDVVESIDGLAVSDWKSMRAAVQAAAGAHPGRPLSIHIRRGETGRDVAVTPDDGGPQGHLLGVLPSMRRTPGKSLATAVSESGAQLWGASVGSLKAISALITGASKARLSGPIGILSHTAEQAKRGVDALLATVVSLSIAIGFFNLLPVPGLDGGRMLLLSVEGVLRRRVPAQVEGYLTMAGLGALLLLMLFVSYGDIAARWR